MAALTGIVSRGLALLARTKDGALSFVGAASRLLNTTRSTISSGLSFGGDYKWFYPLQLYGSVLSFAGSIARVLLRPRTYTGILSFAKTLSAVIGAIRAYAGGISPTGTLSKLLSLGRTYAGSITPSGVIDRVIHQTGITYLAEGVLTFVSSLLITIGKTTSGSILGGTTGFGFDDDDDFGFEDDTGFTWDREVGDIGFVTYLINFKRTVTGALSLGGAYSYILVTASKLLTGVLGFGGSLSRHFLSFRTLTGSITPIGAISSDRRGFRALVGDLSRTIGVFRTKASDLTFAGIVTIEQLQTMLGSLVLSGSIATLYLFYRSLAGAISFSSTVSHYYYLSRTYAGGLSFGGAYSYVVSILGYIAEGGLSFAGVYSRVINLLTRGYAGALSFGGDISRLLGMLTSVPAGVLSFTSSLIGSMVAEGTRQGFMVLGGSVSRVLVTTRTTLAGGLTFAGLDSRFWWAFRSKDGKLSIVGDTDEWKEAMYYGVINP